MTDQNQDNSQDQYGSTGDANGFKNLITTDTSFDFATDPSEFDVASKWVRRYLAYRTTPTFRHETLSESSVAIYESRLREWVNFVQDQELTVLSVEFDNFIEFLRYNIHLGRRTNTIIGRVSVTKMLYKHIEVREKGVEANISPLELDEIKKSAIDEHTPKELEQDALSKEELSSLFDCLDSTRNRLMAIVAVETGFRNSDIRGIRLIDVDLNEPEISAHDPKYGNPYTVPISEELALELDIWQKRGRPSLLGRTDSKFLFPSQEGGRLETGTSLGIIIKTAAERAGIQDILGYTEYDAEYLKNNQIKRTWYEVIPHTLRHTFITLLEQEGVSLEYRRLLANHQSVETTRRYSHGKKKILSEVQGRINLDY